MKNNTFKITGKIVDVVSGRIFPGIIQVEQGRIVSVSEDASCEGPYVLPGLVDAHVHIESSMLVPAEFARIAVTHGTVATVSDPHEIANVLGIEGVEFMIKNGSQVPFKFFFGAPSCVPATGFETSGAVLGVAELDALMARQEIKYMAEMMNWPGVIFGNPEVEAKLALARKYDKPVDGHAPGLTGEYARKYAEAGISTDHECFNLDEAREKLHLGMKVLIREGSAARNFDELLPLIKEFPAQIMFCSDDKHPDELVQGHVNLLVKRAIAAGHHPIDVLRCCTLNPNEHYKLGLGMLQPGDSADFILVDDLQQFNILSTYIEGTLVAQDGKSMIEGKRSEKPNRFSVMDIGIDDLKVKDHGKPVKIIKAIEGQLITDTIIGRPKSVDGYLESDTEKDFLKIVVLNRFEPALPAVGFIHGFGLKRGAIASTVAHDSHNIIACGTSDMEIMNAIGKLIESQGGITATDENRALILPLPVAGLMSDDDGFVVADRYEKANAFVAALGSSMQAPFMTLSFMALLVIPQLKISDKGLFDGQKFEFTSLEAEA
ncbi:MAG TPA: adenine deaminase [Bacteroidales bacterium]|nr:adenine deaminase [Bacteroidales bacterium]